MSISVRQHHHHSTDPLALTLLAAVAVHAALIFGVGFSPLDPPPKQRTQSLDVIVLHQPKPSEPDPKPDFLAPTSQQGGGQLEQVKPVTTTPSPPALEKAPLPTPKLARPKPAPPVEPREHKQKLTAAKAKPKVVTARPRPKAKPTQKPRHVSAQDLLDSTRREIDQLTAKLDQRQQLQSKHKRRKYISSSTQEYKYAAYLEAWRKKVENVGNLNYPDEAKRKQLFGDLRLSVVLNPKGEVVKMYLDKSSGYKVLDDAARRIVTLASPFQRFPPNIRREVDELVITRTWQFRSGNRLFTNK